MHFTKTLLPILWTLIAVVSAVPTPAAVQVDESLITTRAPKTYNLGDASNVEKIKEWMKDNVDNDKFVFYSDDKVGWPWAKAFVAANNGYKHFGLLFDPKYGSKFSSAFGNVDVNSNWDAALACSQAMAEFADGDVRVFNHKGAGAKSVWITIEEPALQANKHVHDIYAMKDGATDPKDHTEDLKKKS